MCGTAVRPFSGGLSKASLFVLLCFVAVTAQGAVRICRSGGVDVMADNTGVAPASALFQKCVDDLTVTVMNLEPGTYLVDRPIVVKRSNLTIRTAGLAGNIQNCQQLRVGSCATFLASPSASAPINSGAAGTDGGLLQVDNRPNKLKLVIFDHLIIDGNKSNRTGGARNQCVAGNNTYGFNCRILECQGTSTSDRCEFIYNFTRNALCGTGLQWAGDYGRIQGNASFNNGVNQQSLWADGITVVRNNNGMVNDNHLVNNTDVALIFGAGNTTSIKSNWIQQNGAYAFAALMLGNFSEAAQDNPERWQTGDYTNAEVKFNTIQCNAAWCGFGINLGPDPWSRLDKELPNVFGGVISQNNISGAKVQINYGGAGMPAPKKMTVMPNTLSMPPGMDVQLGPPGASSRCVAQKDTVQNLYRNNTDGQCGNWVNVDTNLPTSARCFKACF